MGVKDLWQLLSPIGRRVSIETLEGKTLAIDASIWITQFIKAMRDEEGKMMKNAHLIGTIRRVLKLLFHRIRPLFVFDGATPALKLRTVQARRKGHEKQEESKRVAAQRLLRARLKEFALKQSKGASSALCEGAETDTSGTFVASFKRSAGQVSKEETSASSARSLDNDVVETDDVEWMDGYENLKGKDLDTEGNETRGEDGDGEDEMQWQLPEDCAELSAEALAALPPHLRKSLIEEARRRQRMQSRAHYLPVAGNPALYSQTQLSNFLNSSKLNRKFIDAHQSTQSAVVGSSIAAEGKKKYQFLSLSQSQSSSLVVTRQGHTPSASASASSTELMHTSMSASSVAVAASSSSAYQYQSSSVFSAKSMLEGKDASENIGDENDGLGGDSAGYGDGDGDDFWMPQVVYGDAEEEDEEETKKIGATARAVSATREKETTGFFSAQQKEVEEGEEGEEEEREDRDLALAIAASLLDASASVKASAVVNTTEHREEASLRRRLAVIMEDSWDKGHAQQEGEEEEEENVGVDFEVKKKGKTEVTEEGEDDEEVAWETGSSGSSSNNSNSDRGNSDEEDDGCHKDSPRKWCDKGDLWGKSEEPVSVSMQEEVTDGTKKIVDVAVAKVESQTLKDDDNLHSSFKSSDNRGIHISGERVEGLPRSLSLSLSSKEVLDRAVTTASSMADWAGRAVRHALKEHARTTQQQQQQMPDALLSSVASASRTALRTPHVQFPPTASLALPLSPMAKEQESLKEMEVEPDTVEESSTRDSAAFDFTLMSAAESAVETRDARRKFNAAMRDTETLTEEMRCEVIELLQALNLPYLIAPYEAEAQCAVLEQLGLVDGVVTEDSDALLFGASTVYKNIFNDKKYVEVYLAEDARREMGLHREDLVALAYFLGSDYCEGVTGVGIVNAVEIIHAFPMHANANTSADGEQGKVGGASAAAAAVDGPLRGLRRFKEWLHGFDLEQELRFSTSGMKAKSAADKNGTDDEKLVAFTEKHKTGRGRWSVPGSFPDPLVARAYLHPQAERSPDSFAWTLPDARSIRTFCSSRLGWTDHQVGVRNCSMDMAIDPVLRRYAERSNQPRIDAHFLTYHGDTRFAKITSDRLREAVVQITGKRTNLALGGGGAATTSSGGKRAKAKKSKAD